MLVLVFATATHLQPAMGQGINCYSAPSHNPIWRQFGNVNPYSRSYVNPIWHAYSGVHPNYAPVQTTLMHRSAPHQYNAGQFQPSTINSPGMIVEVPSRIENSIVIAPSQENPNQTINSVPIERISDAAHLGIIEELPLSDSLDPASNLDSPERVIADTKDAKQNSQPVESGADAQPSPSDLVLDDQQLSETDADQPADVANEEDDESQRDDELESLKAELSEKEAENRKLSESINKLKTMVEGKILDAIKEKKDKTETEANDSDTQKLIEDAIAKERKAAAWEMAKIRKETEKAKAMLKEARQQAEIDRKLMLNRVQAVESKLQENKARKPNERANDPKKDITKRQTLAELAVQKRNQRTEADNQKAKQSSNASENSDEDINAEMQKQIDRAVGKIQRRFESKIERLSNSDGTDDEIKKLRKEMQIQVEKMEARIRNRYKRRMLSPNQEK